MGKMALATQISAELKSDLDHVCEAKGFTISDLVERALREKLEELREEEALMGLALRRLAEPGEKSYQDFQRFLKRLS